MNAGGTDCAQVTVILAILARSSTAIEYLNTKSAIWLRRGKFVYKGDQMCHIPPCGREG